MDQSAPAVKIFSVKVAVLGINLKCHCHFVQMIIKLVLLSLYVTCSAENETLQSECLLEDYPFVVAILYGGGLKYEPSCTGTLLSQYWVLTSGSCLTECAIPQLYIAVIGAEVVVHFVPFGRKIQRSQAKYCYLYPDLTRTVDLALMELEIPLALEGLITYVNLATYLDVADREFESICKEGMTVGLGSGQPLGCASVSVLSQKKCEKRLNQSNIRDEHLCASALEDTRPCPRERGGPLMCRGVQYGVVTYSYSCSSKDQPVLITRVDKYENFIKGVIMDKNVEEILEKSECSRNNAITLWIFTFLLIFRLFN